jgi:uncharacterized protein YkwD
MKHILSLALLVSLVIEASSAPATAAGKRAYTFSTAPSVNVSMADEILKYINEYRRKKGLPPMAMNAVMNTEAQKHSENMAARRTSFGHNGFQGRLKRISPVLNGVSAAAENVAMGSTTAREVVDNWLKSSVHRQNIEGPYNLTGIGVAPDKKGVLYFTQLFASSN